MPIGRNDPCPCGSGRKYKQCCQPRDMAAAAGGAGGASAPWLNRQLRAVAAAERDWEADAVPIMARFADGDSPRPVMLIVLAGEIMVHADVRGRLRGETTDVAAALERAVVAAARETGVFPERLRVRHDDVAAVLAPLLAERGVAVRGGGVPVLEATVHDMIESIAGGAFWPPVCHPDTWSAWDLPRPLVAELFAAAAHYYRQAPWKDVENLQAPRATLPSGRAWTCCMLGNAGQEYGLALYTEPTDPFRTALSVARLQPFTGVRGRIISITFERTADVDAAMRHEVRLHRWQTAGSAAMPTLTTVNTPGGGIAQDDARDLIALCHALPAFVQAHRHALRGEARTGQPARIDDWTEPDSGIVFHYDGAAVRHHPLAFLDDDDDFDVDDDFDDDFDDFDDDIDFDVDLFDDDDEDDDVANLRLVAGLPPELRAQIDALIEQVVEEVGADADEDELLATLNRRLAETMLVANAQPQADFGGLSPEQVRRLLQGGWGEATSALQLRRDLSFDDVAGSTILANARTLLTFAVEHGPPGATQAGRLKLDAVAALLDRMTFRDRYVELLRSGSRRITEQDVWPLHQLRIVCELAGLLRRRSQRFDLTATGRRLADAAHAGELFALLFLTWFRKFNLDYGSRWEWPELQHQLAYTLHRLPAAAQEWRTAESLLPDVVLPYALQQAPVSAGGTDYLLAQISLAADVLDPLAGFGLLERRDVDAGSGSRRDELYRVTPLAGRFLRFEL